MRFPLPTGHKFGYNTTDLRFHDGSNLFEAEHLAEWQRKYAFTVDRDQPITGRYDGPTQRAVVRVQREHGILVSGNLDEDTWDALFAAPVPIVAEVPETALGSPQEPVEASGVVLDTPDAPEPQEAPQPAVEAPATRRGPGRPPKAA